MTRSLYLSIKYLGSVKSRLSRRSGKNSYGTGPLPEHKVVGEGEQEIKDKVM
jgi:hypothetical protein